MAAAKPPFETSQSEPDAGPDNMESQAQVYRDVFMKLSAPFTDDEVTCQERDGTRFYSVTARSVMNRLDGVLGPQNWNATYTTFGPIGEVMCTLTVSIMGETITRQGFGRTYADNSSRIANGPAKASSGDALKLAAMALGVGRYLWSSGVPTYDGSIDIEMVDPREVHDNVQVSRGRGRDDNSSRRRDHDDRDRGDRGRDTRSYRDSDRGRDRDRRPAREERREERRDSRRDDRGRGSQSDAPRTGKALFAWLMKQKENTGLDTIKWANSFLKLNDIDARITDLSDRDIDMVYEAACRKLRDMDNDSQDNDQDDIEE